ncbi:hypothetical protein HK405_001962, partial [Cladochytrium tenue]
MFDFKLPEPQFGSDHSESLANRAIDIITPFRSTVMIVGPGRFAHLKEIFARLRLKDGPLVANLDNLLNAIERLFMLFVVSASGDPVVTFDTSRNEEGMFLECLQGERTHL